MGFKEEFVRSWRAEVKARKRAGTFPGSVAHPVDKEIAYLKALKKDGSLIYQEF